jgi:hypothetical protein
MKQIDKTQWLFVMEITVLGYHKKRCKDIDILGTNVYRGLSLEMHSKSKEVLNKPIMFTEFGADAFNVINKSEDQNLRLIIC